MGTITIYRKNVVFISCFLFVAGLFSYYFFRALPSIAMGLIFIAGISGLNYKAYPKNRALFFFSLIFFLYTFSTLLNSTAPFSESLDEILMKSGFFILPFAFSVTPGLKERNILLIYYFFLLVLSVTALGTFINFLLHFKEISESYIHSKIMPTPVNHVRYSLILAFGVISGAYLYYRDFYYKYNWEKKLILFLTLFLFAFIHILSVRSGILALYCAITVGGIAYAKSSGQWKPVLGAFLALLVLPFACWFFVPTFQNKVSNTFEDLKRLGEKGAGKDYSLAGRVESYKVAAVLINENPILGTGPANLEAEVTSTYKRIFNMPEEGDYKFLVPHNQFLHTAAATGILGLIIFIFCFYYPLFKKGYKNPLMLTHYVILTVSFMFEATLETQTGTNYALIFALLPLFIQKEASYTS